MKPPQTLKFKCPQCHRAGSVKFSGDVRPFDFVSLSGDFKLDISQPHNFFRCDCGCPLLMVRADSERWRIIDPSDRREWEAFADRLMRLHLKLESDGRTGEDWRLARALEDRIGSLQGVVAKDLCQADELLAKVIPFSKGDLRRMLSVLAVIDAPEGASLMRISAATGLDKKTVTHLIQQAQEEGDVVIEKSVSIYRITNWGAVLKRAGARLALAALNYRA